MGTWQNENVLISGWYLKGRSDLQEQFQCVKIQSRHQMRTIQMFFWCFFLNFQQIKVNFTYEIVE